MNIRHLLLLTVLFPLIAAADEAGTDLETIGWLIDDFHDAAAHGDKARYLGHLTENAVFMGTDEWERWPKHPDFSDYVGGRFKDGKGWSYESVERTIRIAETANFAWFDEVLFSEQNGRFRGTGVLILQDDNWKIAHYAISFLILNENWEEVVNLTRETKNRIENSQP